MLPKKHKRAFLAGQMYLFFVTGVMVLSTSALQMYMRTDFSLTQGQGGLLVSCQAFGYLLANLFAGQLSVYTGRKKLLFVAAALICLNYGGLALIPTSSPVLLYILLFFAGVGWGINNNLLNTMVSEECDKNGSELTLVHLCYAIGAFVAPLSVAAVLSFGGTWRTAVIPVSVAAAVLFITLIKAPVPEKTREEGKAIAFSMSFAKDPRFYCLFLVLFMYVGAENGFSTWLPSYLIQNSFFSEELAQTILSMLWILMIVGRVATIFIARKVNTRKFAFIICTAFFVTSGLFLLTSNPYLMIALVALVGLSMAGIFTMTFASAGEFVTGSGIGASLILSSGAVGAMAIPYITGAIADAAGLQAGLWTITGAAGCTALFSLLVIVFSHLKNQKTNA